MIRERDLQGALKGEEPPKESEAKEEEDNGWSEAIKKDRQLRRAIELLEGWEIFSKLSPSERVSQEALPTAAEAKPTTR